MATEYDQKVQRQEAARRALNIDDKRVDELVRVLCEHYGYGTIMDSAARQWAKKDPFGAFYIGGCLEVQYLGHAAEGNFDTEEKS